METNDHITLNELIADSGSGVCGPNLHREKCQNHFNIQREKVKE